MSDETINTEVNTEPESVNTVNPEVETPEVNTEEDKNWKAMRAKQKELEKKLQAYEEEKRLKEEEELKAKGEYQKLLEQREAEIQKMKQEALQAKASKQIQAELVRANLNPEAMELLEAKALELATIDDTGEVTNISEVSNVLSNNYAFLFQKGIKSIPSTGQATTTQMMTFDQWSQLSTEEKDKALKDGRFTF